MADRIEMIQVDVGYACGGIEVKASRVVLAAPIFRWMLGKTFDEVERWVKKKHGYMRRCNTNG